MLAIGLSLYIRSQLPIKRKLILSCIFGVGIFVILSAVLNKYYSFTQPFGALWTFWYVREASTALLVANFPFTWTLLRRVFHLHSFEGSESSSRYSHSRTTLSRWSCATLRKLSGGEKNIVRCEGLTTMERAVVRVDGEVAMQIQRVEPWDYEHAVETPMERVVIAPKRRATSFEEGKTFIIRHEGCPVL